MNMKVGFTGTQDGMTPDQHALLWEALADWNISEFHHGDCTGADAEAHNLVQGISDDIRVVIHPPENELKRAFCAKADDVRPARPYLERNHDIVNATEALIACPGERHERLRSGTWATVRYARKQGLPILIIYPDGTYDEECWP